MKKILSKNRDVIVQITCYLYVLLFVYAAISKLLDFEDFGIQLAQSPLLGDSLVHTVSFEDAYFSQLEAMDSVNFAFRTQGAETKAQVQVRSLSGVQHKMGAPHCRSIRDRSYRTDRQEYLGSFYVHNRGSHKMARMIVTDRHLFVLSGNKIVRYRFAQPVTRHFNTGRVANLD